MLLKIKKYCSIIPSIFFLLIMIGCAENQKNDPSEISEKSQNQNHKQMLDEVKKYNHSFEKIFPGIYDNSGIEKIAAVLKVVGKIDDGLKISLLSKSDESFKNEFTSPFVIGDMWTGIFTQIKNPNKPYQYLRFSTGDYFLGTGGGEVYDYVIDFQEKKTYYAHLFIYGARNPVLFIQKENQSDFISIYLLNEYKKDYPDLILTDIEPTL